MSLPKNINAKDCTDHRMLIGIWLRDDTIVC
jgi:hypothetical protein